MHWLEEKILEDWQIFEDAEYELKNAKSLGVSEEEVKQVMLAAEQRIYRNDALLNKINQINERIYGKRSQCEY
jgi:hypothetical protein